MLSRVRFRILPRKSSRPEPEIQTFPPPGPVGHTLRPLAVGPPADWGWGSISALADSENDRKRFTAPSLVESGSSWAARSIGRPQAPSGEIAPTAVPPQPAENDLPRPIATDAASREIRAWRDRRRLSNRRLEKHWGIVPPSGRHQAAHTSFRPDRPSISTFPYRRLWTNRISPVLAAKARQGNLLPGRDQRDFSLPSGRIRHNSPAALRQQGEDQAGLRASTQTSDSSPRPGSDVLSRARSPRPVPPKGSSPSCDSRRRGTGPSLEQAGVEIIVEVSSKPARPPRLGNATDHNWRFPGSGRPSPRPRRWRPSGIQARDRSPIPHTPTQMEARSCFQHRT